MVAVTGMRFRTLRSRACRAVRELDTAVGIPRPFDLDVLLDRLEQRRGKPIDLHETPTLGGKGPCGLWIQQADRDVIAFAADTSAVHQSHIILHELGHMIAGHQENCVLEVHTVSELVPLVPVQLVEHMFARSSYDATEEQEAELIACLIRLAAEEAGPRSDPGRHLSGPDADYIARLARVFGD